MILITGANGHLGSQTIDSLLEKNSDETIAGLVRSERKGKELKEKGVELRIGDYTDIPSLGKAMKGVETLLLISTSTMQNRVKQHENVINSAKEAGVNHIFYTSVVHADELLSPLSPDHHETEKILKASGITYTIYRHTFYTEFFPMFLGNALETGQWVLPSNGQKINLAYRTEMAEALANGLADTDRHRNKVYEITSNEAYTLDELAQIVSKETGKEITYTDLPVKEFEGQLKQAGLPEDTIGMAMLTAETVADGALAHTSGDLEKLLGRKPASLPEFIQAFAG